MAVGNVLAWAGGSRSVSGSRIASGLFAPLSRRGVIRLISALMCAWAPPVLAAGTISCQSVGHPTPATIEITVGQLAALAPVSLTVTIGDQSWSTDPEGGATIPIAILQAFDDGQSLRIDVTDPNLLELLFTIRLLRVAEAHDLAHAGILRFVGTGAYSLVCEGP